MKQLRAFFYRLLGSPHAGRLLLIGLVLLPVLTSWIGDIVREWAMECFEKNDCSLGTVGRWLLPVSIVLSLVLLRLLLRMGRELIAPRIVTQQKGNVSAHPVLIALLSPQEGLSFDESAWRLNGQPLPATIAELSDREFRIAGAFSWQQTLRAARHHHKSGALKKLALIGSKDALGAGSAKDLVTAKQFFGHYLPGVAILTPGLENAARYSPDFEDLEATRKALQAMIRHCDAADRDIIIDVTGGPKTASIAATLVTLDRADLMFQYVGTHDKIGQIFGFDAVTERSQG